MSLHALSARRVVPARAWRRDLARDVLPVYVATRLFFVACTLVLPLLLSVTGTTGLIPHGETGTPFDAWSRYDVRWYDDLARFGYNLHGPDDYKNVAFFPLFPLLTRSLHDVLTLLGFGHVSAHAPDPLFLVAGMLVSNACALVAFAFFYGLVRLDHGRPVARRAVTLLALSPLGFYFFAAYSESTFLLCAVGCFYALRLERWRQAGLWGLLAAATRPPGAVLVVPFALAWAGAHPIVTRPLVARLRLAGRAVAARVRARRVRGAVVSPHAHAAVPLDLTARRTAVPLDLTARRTAIPLDLTARRTGGRTPRRRAGDLGGRPEPETPASVSSVSGVSGVLSIWRPRHWPEEVWHALRNAAPAAAIPLGLGLFMAFLYRFFGNPLWFSEAQHAWWRTFAPPWETLIISVTWPLGDLLGRHVTYWDPFALHDLAYEVAGLVLTWQVWRFLPRAQSVYVWLIWIVILSSPAMLDEQLTHEPHRDVLMSLPRMLLMMFPLFTYLALRRRLYPWLTAAFAAGLIFYTMRFLTGGWIS